MCASIVINSMLQELRRGIANKSNVVAMVSFPLMALFFYVMISKQYPSPSYGILYFELFMFTYTVIPFSLMSLGIGLVIQKSSGHYLKLLSLPRGFGQDLLGKFIANFILIMLSIVMSIFAVWIGNFIVYSELKPVLLPLSVIISIIPIYIITYSVTLLLVIFARNPRQYQAFAILYLNLVPVLSGMFVPLLMFPEPMRKALQFNPYSIPYISYYVKTPHEERVIRDLVVNLGTLICVSYGIATLLLILTIYLFHKAKDFRHWYS